METTWPGVALALIAALVGAFGSWMAYMQSKTAAAKAAEIHVLVNSQKDALVAEITALKEELRLSRTKERP
jgi:hypothetical protein